MTAEYVLHRVDDLTDPSVNRISNMTVADARARVASGSSEAVAGIHGSFALVARDGEAVRMARSLDRPLRYFLAKEAAGPSLVVSDRIDAILEHLRARGLAVQFHPTYTRMVPAHHVLDLRLVGCPDPSPTWTRFFAPPMASLPPDLDAIGRAYAGALVEEVAEWLRSLREDEPVGVCFSGGVDSGAVLLAVYFTMRRLALPLGRLKAFTLDAGHGEDLEQARRFVRETSLEMFLEPVATDPAALDPLEAVRIVEDYKPLDVQSATVGIALLRAIRARYPEWRHLADGDGGDENLKDYPIEENPELTIRSVVSNPMLYQEGWGVGRLKHSLTFSGGQSRSCTRSYAPLRRFGFEGFSPFMRPRLIAIAESIPFAALTGGDVARLYALKGEVLARGMRDVTGMRLPVFPKRRFQHGASRDRVARERLALPEDAYRAQWLSQYA
ncbi:MAG TPA: asparagine synthase-related protein [Thermoanaerobaculia bacterium]|nr:asparagine synthase-related protein [Thermoanaerobaculia bacterium]